MIDSSKRHASALAAQIAEVLKSADELALKAEEKLNLSLIMQSNSSRKTAQQKKEELAALDVKIKDLVARCKK